MSTDWQRVRVTDIAAPSRKAIAIGPFGSKLKAELYTSSGVPVVRGQDITEFKDLDESTMPFVSNATADSLQDCIVRPGDLIFPHRGAIGRVGVVIDKEYLLSSSMMKLTCNTSVAHPHFVFYYFRGPGREELLSRASTVGTPGIGQPLKSLREIPVRLPPLAVQVGIAKVLGALDDKIAANSRILKTCDDLVRSRWDSLAGEGDGDAVEIGSLVVEVRDQVNPAELLEDSAYLGLEHIPRRLMWQTEIGSAAMVTSLKTRFDTGDLLFGKLRPYFHKVVIATFDGICSTDIIVARPLVPDFGGFALAAISSDAVIAHCVAASEGTRMPRSRWKDLSSATVPWPGESEARAFSAVVVGLAGLVTSLASESRALAELRDTLLPHLMSGRLRVKDAEKQVEEVV